MKYALTIMELLKRPIIRNDKSFEWENKMTDEELKDLVNRGLEEAFFRERKVTTDSWGHTKIEPPFLHEILKELMIESVDKHVSEFINEHPDDVMKAIKEAHSLGMGNAIMLAITNKFQMDFIKFQTSIEQRLNNS